jgi:hypothetical protein
MDAGSIAAVSQWCLPVVSSFFICENLLPSVFILVKGADFLFNRLEAESFHSCSFKSEFRNRKFSYSRLWPEMLEQAAVFKTKFFQVRVVVASICRKPCQDLASNNRAREHS